MPSPNLNSRRSKSPVGESRLLLTNRSTMLLTKNASQNKMNNTTRNQRNVVYYPENESALFFKENDVGPAQFVIG